MKLNRSLNFQSSKIWDREANWKTIKKSKFEKNGSWLRIVAKMPREARKKAYVEHPINKNEGFIHPRGMTDCLFKLDPNSIGPK